MNINIGNNIKSLRRTKDITQEQLAEAMNVSTTAVSKWERGETYPDITLIFPLAYFFGVSVDDLMGYNSEKINEEIEDIIHKFAYAYLAGDSNASELITEAYKKYPNDDNIMNIYMWNLVNKSNNNSIWNFAGIYNNNTTEPLLENKDELIKICDKLDKSSALNIRQDSIYMRGLVLYAEGKKDEASDLYFENLPDRRHSYEEKCEQMYNINIQTENYHRTLFSNIIDLAGFSAHKKVTEIWYCNGYTLQEKIEQGLMFASAVEQMRKSTGYDELCIVENQIFIDLVGKFSDSEITPDELASLLDKLFEKAHQLDTIIITTNNQLLRKFRIGQKYLRGVIAPFETLACIKRKELGSNAACIAVVEKWKNKELD